MTKACKSAILFVVALFFNITAIHAYDPGYYFDTYHFDMTVHEDGSYDVVESIDAVFTEESRGIFREIPTLVWVKRDVSDNQDGSKTKMLQYHVDVDNVEVSEETSEEDADGLYSIRIGSADKYITGPHSYTIKYTLTPYGDRVEQSDLFFYSVLGVGWDCKTNQFTFTIHFDKPLKDEELAKLEVFTGELGDNTNFASQVITKATTTEIQGVRRDIAPHEAITVRVPLREGYFAESIHPKLEINLAWCLLIITAILVLVVLFLELRPQDVPTKIISFHPPKGMTSADVGVIAEASIENNSILSLIPWLAEQGCITIDNTSEHPILRLANGLPDKCPEYVKSLFNGMFEKDQKIVYTHKPSPGVGRGWYNCERALIKLYTDKLNKSDLSYMWILQIAIFAVSFANCFASVCDGWLVGGFTTAFFEVVVIIQASMTGSTSPIISPLKGSVIIGLSAAFYICLIYSGCYNTEDPTYIPVEYLYAINAAMLVVCYLFIRSEKVTDARKQHLGEIMGLKEFIETAEKDQLEKLQAEDEKYYYNILPYAVALGLADKWAKKFKDIMVKEPEWYKGKAGEVATAAVASLVAHSVMSRGIKNSISSARPRSSYSSSSGSSYSSSRSYSSRGGGYSGGGFGGGGGRRW